MTTVTRREVIDALLIGYARVSTDEQDLTAQRDAVAALGVSAERTYVDQGLTGTNRERPGLRQAMAACRSGDTLVVTKLDRLARSLPDARAIVEDLTRRQVKLSLGGAVHDPTDPVGRLLFNVLAMVAEFEGDLIRMRTREGMSGQGQGPPAGQAAEAQRPPRSPRGGAASRRRAQRRGARRPVRSHSLDCVPNLPARRRPPTYRVARTRLGGSPCDTARRSAPTAL